MASSFALATTASAAVLALARWRRSRRRSLQEVSASTVASELCARGYCFVDGVLGSEAAADVRAGVQELERNGEMHLGKLQHGTTQNLDDEVRNDKIVFLKPEARCTEALRSFMAGANGLRERLSQCAELVELLRGDLDGCTFMCAAYPGEGGHYVKHRDALPYQAGRKLTMIYYLNERWRPEDGGELQLWPEWPAGQAPVRVAPRSDRLLFFVSSLEHEVMPTWRPRYALTTWHFNRRAAHGHSVAPA
jgi:hypothetical protein